MLLFIVDKMLPQKLHEEISIHPMLLFIQAACFLYLTRILISIHPMLLFILLYVRYSERLFHFNTSHVTVYQEATSNDSN